MRSTKAIINLSSFRNNLREIKRNIGENTKMCVAVKANAYGHGAVECARTAVECGAEFLAVATVGEGIELRKNGIKARILMLSLCDPGEIHDAVKNCITPLAFDREYISLFADECRKEGIRNYNIHIAVDTGMGRIGALKEDVAEIALYAKSVGLNVEGMCTHFSVADSVKPEDIEYTDMQFKNFMEAVGNVESAGIKVGLRHCCNSPATLSRKEFHLDMVRPGIVCYGYYPGDLTREYFEKSGNPVDLKPVMTLKTKVCAIRNFSRGQSISYGRTWTSDADTKIAVLPAGYGDGMLRAFSTAGVKIGINGKSYPIRGRICMDQCMVDIGNDDIERFSEAVIFGDKEMGAIEDADDIALKTNTISYEITTGISPRVERIFINQGNQA